MSVPRDLADAHHYHIHLYENAEVLCYGDMLCAEQAEDTVAALSLDQDDLLFFIVDAPVCIDVCRKD